MTSSPNAWYLHVSPVFKPATHIQTTFLCALFSNSFRHTAHDTTALRPHLITQVAWVPGSMELPLAAKRFALSGHHSAVVAIGCVVRGETSHYDAVVRGATSGIERASSDSGVPVVFGVLTCDTMEQAIDRAGGKLGNSGDGYAASAVQMANLMHSI